MTAQTDAPQEAPNYCPEGGGTTSGSFTVAAGGGVLDLYGTQDFTAASTLAGAGLVEVISGDSTFGGTYDVTGKTSILAGTADFTGTVESVGDTFKIDQGIVNFQPTNSPVTLNGFLNMDDVGSLTVASWRGAVPGGGGSITYGLITVSAGAELDLAGMASNSLTAVDNAGILNISNSFLGSSGQWTNALQRRHEPRRHPSDAADGVRQRRRHLDKQAIRN